MIIAIDGTFASGKGTLARKLAAHFDLPHLDTGKLYRATALSVIRSGGTLDNPEDATQAAKALTPDLLEDPEIRSPGTGAGASVVAAIPSVRAALKHYQQDFANQPGGAILDGRDIGTVICPDADVKLFVDAAPEERARRRHAEFAARGDTDSYADVLAQLKARDARDAGRKDAPMKAADDAHLIDTTDLDADAAFDVARRIIEAVQALNS